MNTLCVSVYLDYLFISPAFCSFQHPSPVQILLGLYLALETPVLC